MIEIKFRRKYLRKCFEEEKEAIKKWGKSDGKSYIKAIFLIQATDSIDDLFLFPQLRFHPLTGDLDGFHAIKLTARARLITSIESSSCIVIEKVDPQHYE